MQTNMVKSQEITIRRLQEQIAKIKEQFTNKEAELEKEVGTWREAYRECLADLEREKETKNTLQQCLDTLQKTNSRNSANNVTFEDQAGSTVDNVKICRFYNKRNGCRNGDQCRFEHKEMPPCRNQPHCRKRGCKFNHKNESSANTERSISPHLDGDEGDDNREPRVCRFFNRRAGCNKGDQCTFLHEMKPPCTKQNCDGKICNFDHKPSGQSNNNFLGGSRNNLPPDPNIRSSSNIAEKDFQKLIQIQVEKQISQKFQEKFSQLSQQSHHPGPNHQQTTMTATTPVSSVSKDTIPQIYSIPQNGMQKETAAIYMTHQPNKYQYPQQAHQPQIPLYQPTQIPSNVDYPYFQTKPMLNQTTQNSVPIQVYPTQNLQQFLPSFPIYRAN